MEINVWIFMHQQFEKGWSFEFRHEGLTNTTLLNADRGRDHLTFRGQSMAIAANKFKDWATNMASNRRDNATQSD